MVYNRFNNHIYFKEIMKNFLYLFLITTFTFLMISCSTGDNQSITNKAKIKAIYDAWDTGTKEEWMSAYLDIMTEDFTRWNGRYVGLGFTINNEDMTVLRTTGTPANENLKVGDKFLTVNGIQASTENSDELPFQGPVGGDVTVVVDRNGENIEMTMQRAAQVNISNQSEIRENLENWSDYDNRPRMLNVGPMTAEGNEVWGHFELGFETPDGNLVRWWVIERFIFNESGEMTNHYQIQEDLFREAQLGGYITYD